jgi:hypothetical protein
MKFGGEMDPSSVSKIGRFLRLLLIQIQAQVGAERVGAFVIGERFCFNVEDWRVF